jgi:hypothetical protein
MQRLQFVRAHSVTLAAQQGCTALLERIRLFMMRVTQTVVELTKGNRAVLSEGR